MKIEGARSTDSAPVDVQPAKAGRWPGVERQGRGQSPHAASHSGNAADQRRPSSVWGDSGLPRVMGAAAKSTTRGPPPEPDGARDLVRFPHPAESGGGAGSAIHHRREPRRPGRMISGSSWRPSACGDRRERMSRCINRAGVAIALEARGRRQRDGQSPVHGPWRDRSIGLGIAAVDRDTGRRHCASPRPRRRR